MGKHKKIVSLDTGRIQVASEEFSTSSIKRAYSKTTSKQTDNNEKIKNK